MNLFKNTAAIRLALALAAGLFAAAPAPAQDAITTASLAPAPSGQAAPVSATLTAPSAAPKAPRVESDPLKEKGIRFNFRKAPLDTVLDYLSKAAGLIIVRDAEIAGTVDVVSQQSLTLDEAVALLDTVLNQKGLAAIRNERTLTIVPRDKAKQRDIPVNTGNRPESIPKTDKIVTQIIPVRYGNASQIIENIGGLLPSYASISANQSVNAIILTDTQSNIRRMAEIIKALDTAISEISTLEVFRLQNADAKDVASMINQLFGQDASRNNAAANQNNFRMRGMFGGGFPGMMGGMPGAGGAAGVGGGTQPQTSEALKTASRVQAVADERTNAIIVSAPEELIPTIQKLVEKTDTSADLITEVRVFTLRYANSDDTAAMITTLFSPNTSNSSSQQPTFFGGFMRGMMGGASQQSGTQTQSQRQRKETTVQAVSDPRTNSIVVTAIPEVMAQIAETINKLDANPAKEQKVFVYRLKYAKPDAVADILNSMFGTGTGTLSQSKSNSASRSNAFTNSSSSNARSGSSGASTNSGFGTLNR